MKRDESIGWNWKKEMEEPEFDVELAHALLLEAGICRDTVESLGNDESLQLALEVLAEFSADREIVIADDWWKRLLSLQRDHWVCTEEFGWMPAECNSRETTGEDPMPIVDEVNAPVPVAK